MFPTPLKTFHHPKKVYHLEYPAHWDQVTQKDGESCGFGPHERDDVGLWISIMPMSLDTEKIQHDLPRVMQQAIASSGAENLRKDESLRHFAMIADMTKDGQGGHYWIVTGGDVILFASTQVPVAERDTWNPPFQQLMASLRITRDDELFLGKLAHEVMSKLKERHPDEEFTFEGDKIRGGGRVVFLTNLLREVRSAPKGRDRIINHFVDTLSQPGTEDLGYEEWEEIRGVIVPVLKPREYIDKDGPTRHFQTSEWLPGVFICYAIKNNNMFRFVTGWDVNRWEITAEKLHEEALANLLKMPWPREMIGSRTNDNGRVIVVDTDDNMASSRLLHPDLHRLFSGPLGRTFWAGIPCRDRLVLYSDRRELKQRIARRIRKDHDSSAYPITHHSFLVTKDGVAPGPKKGS